MTATQTTVVLASTASFPAPAAGQQFAVVIIDKGNPLYTDANPLATPYEYQPVTLNTVGTNTLTFASGVRAAFAGTTPSTYFAGASVAAVLLGEGLTGAFARIDTSNPIFTAQKFASVSATPPTLGALQAGFSAQNLSFGTDARGLIVITTGGSTVAANSPVAILNFASGYATTPVAFASMQNGTFNGFTAVPTTSLITFYTGLALNPSSSYGLGYWVIV